MQTPVTIFGGYLGSGKTTIILNALKQYRKPVKFAMIKNEYGDVNVDAQLARNANLRVKEVVNGCLCCVLVGELNPGINELIDQVRPERIIIEASGNALPFPIILELKKNPKVYVDGVIVVVDCLNFVKVKDKSFVARDQAKHTDLIIFNKTGLVDENKLYQVREDINDLNPDTVKIETAGGVVKPQVLFGLPNARDKWAALDALTSHEHHEHETVETFGWETTGIVRVELIDQVVKACRPNSFYRIKGILKTGKGWQLVNGVFGRITWQALPNFKADKSQVVFIGSGIKQWEGQVKEYLEKAVGV
ncbi:hypothetical protein A2W24_02740 [Microgenomates group bacterium RBG_16_45_19]|nr:MAG: hypothetical protein A2W24_02740 [Microgenomates group bacterium RBG_16_45_19]